MPLTVSSPYLESLARRRAREDLMRQEGGRAAGQAAGAFDFLYKDQQAQQKRADDLTQQMTENENKARSLALDEQHQRTADAQNAFENTRALRLDDQAAEQRAEKTRALALESDKRDREHILTAEIDAAIENGETPDALASRLQDMPETHVNGSTIGSAEVLARYQARKRQRIAEDAALEGTEAKTDQAIAAAEKARRPVQVRPPKPPKASEGEANAIAEMRTSQANADHLLSLIDQTPTGVVSAGRAAIARTPVVGEVIGDAVDPGAKATTLYDALESFKTGELKRLSGSGVTEGERAAFDRFQAAIHGSPARARAALVEYKNTIAREEKIKRAAMAELRGIPDDTAAPSTSAAHDPEFDAFYGDG